MDQISPMPSHELPMPQQNNVINDGGELVVKAPESYNNAPSGERIAQAAGAVAQAVNDDSTIVSVPQITNIANPTSVSFTVPTTAADANRIEKEWVAIAKFIINSTKSDPRSRSSELSSFKHEYIKKRYGKVIKLSDDRIT